MAKVDAQGHDIFENYTKRQCLEFWASSLNTNATRKTMNSVWAWHEPWLASINLEIIFRCEEFTIVPAVVQNPEEKTHIDL